jgi:hypothetical protein
VIAAAAALTIALALPLQPGGGSTPEIATLKAGLGTCSADFTVSGADGKPVYAASVRVRVRYGMFGIKRADLEVGTNSDGKARIEGLPVKAKPLKYEIEKDGAKAAVDQDVARDCRAVYTVALK